MFGIPSALSALSFSSIRKRRRKALQNERGIKSLRAKARVHGSPSRVIILYLRRYPYVRV